MTTALLFVASLILVVVASELFTNAIEWAGFHLNLGTGATGSLLAALGTSLPGDGGADRRARDALAARELGRHRRRARLAVSAARRSARARPASRCSSAAAPAVWSSTHVRRAATSACFSAPSSSRCCRACCPRGARIVVGVGLLVAYAVYVVATLRGSGQAGDMPEPLHIVRWRPGEPHPVLVDRAARHRRSRSSSSARSSSSPRSTGRRRRCRSPALVLALVIVPVATELPETLNSVLWVRTQRRHARLRQRRRLGHVSVVRARQPSA